MEQLAQPEQSTLYGPEYYRTGCGIPYERNDHWLNFFGLVADEIIRSLKPRTVFDAGCAMGFLVEALWDRGVEARGVDLSEYAIAQVRRDIQPYCRQGSVLEPIEGRYDLVTCIEVLEHLRPEQTEAAISNLAQLSDTILFSSTPFDLSEPTHFNVRPVIGWLRLFAAVGFWPDCIFDASFIAPHAFLLRRQDPLPDDVLMLFSEKIRLKCALVERDQRIGALNHRIAELTKQLNDMAPEIARAPADLSEAQSENGPQLQHELPVLAEDVEMLSEAQHVHAEAELWRLKAAELQTEAARLRQELSLVYESPAWTLIARYRRWLDYHRRTSRWIRVYEKAVNHLIRRGGFSPSVAVISSSGSHPSSFSQRCPLTSAIAFESYEDWTKRAEPTADALDLQRRLSRQLRLQPLFSVVVPVYKVPLRVLQEMVESVLNQTYHNRELCIAHGYPPDREGREYLQSLTARNSRVKVKFLDRNEGIAGNSNAALELVAGEFVALLDHDDMLAPSALYEMASAINEQPDAGFLYSDKDCVTEDSHTRLRPLFKPSWSPDIMLSVNYLTHLCVIRADIIRAIGGWRRETEGAQDWDLFLRIIDRGAKVVFVPKVLYHWRIISSSVAAGGLDVKPYAAKGQIEAINDHVERIGIPAAANFDHTGVVNVQWTKTVEASVSVILVSLSDDPNRIADLARRAGVNTRRPNLEIIGVLSHGSAPPRGVRVVPTHAADSLPARLNRAVKASRGDFIVFLDEAVAPDDPNWLDQLIGPLQIPGVALVGVKTIDSKSGNLRHAGLVFNLDGTLDYIFSGEPEHVDEQFGAAHWLRNWSAVAGACFAIRRHVFDLAGGFHEHPAYPRHDVDLCLRIREGAERRIVYNPLARFTQERPGLLETWLSADGAEKGSAYVRACFPSGDPYFNRNLQSRGGKVLFGPLRSHPPTLDYAAEARALVSMFDVTRDAIAASKAAMANPPRHSIGLLTWVLPEFAHPFYGGVHTILRFADYFRRAHQVESDFVVLGSVPEAIMQSRIAAAFPNLAAAAQVTRIRGGDDWSRVRPSDATIATLWTTAYPTLSYRNTRRKFYFVQDYESQFYPAGSISSLVEATYRFGYYGICNTRSLRDLYQELGGEAEYFDPCVDRDYFFPPQQRNSGRPFMLFCYARPGHPRNCFELLSAALKQVKGRMGAGIRIISAGADWRPADYGLDGVVENLGLLSYAATGALYRACDAGVVMMTTRHPSYLPLELMACGALVITNYNQHTQWLFRDGENCLLTDATPGSVAAAIEAAASDGIRRQAIAERGAKLVQTEYSDWDAQAEKIYQYILKKC
jgi:cellulose synthase/poly-beta-1,6-N-acetylglucosamine synthase-like glycosyltransferase